MTGRDVLAARFRGLRGLRTKTIRFRGHEFYVERPHRCRIRVTSPNGYVGEITVHEATGKYREGVHDDRADHPTLEAALHSMCDRLLDRESRPTREALCEPMEAFYWDLKDEGA